MYDPPALGSGTDVGVWTVDAAAVSSESLFLPQFDDSLCCFWGCGGEGGEDASSALATSRRWRIAPMAASDISR